MKKLVLFDIDGTILWTHGAGRRAIRQALLDELGTTGPIDGLRFDGKTDPQIIRELMQAAEPPLELIPERVLGICRRYVQLLSEELGKDGVRVEVLGGILQLLDSLEADGTVLTGLLTGNLVEGARLKLRAGGIDPARFRVGAFGSDSHIRSELPALAAERAAPEMGRTPSGPEVIIVGDTPADMTCGAGIGARALGVATGNYSSTELRAAGAYRVFPDLTETDAVMEAIFA